MPIAIRLRNSTRLGRQARPWPKSPRRSTIKNWPARNWATLLLKKPQRLRHSAVMRRFCILKAWWRGKSNLNFWRNYLRTSRPGNKNWPNLPRKREALMTLSRKLRRQKKKMRILRKGRLIFLKKSNLPFENLFLAYLNDGSPWERVWTRKSKMQRMIKTPKPKQSFRSLKNDSRKKRK